MIKASKLIVLVALMAMFLSCDKNEIDYLGTDYLIFGHFYGFCEGETCIETFLLTDTKLYEDLNDDYSFDASFNFDQLGNSEFNQVKDLWNLFPAQLLNEPEGTIGCPDCADQGGLLIEYSENGVVKRWRLDNNKNSVPAYLHNFMDEVDVKIALLSQ